MRKNFKIHFANLENGGEFLKVFLRNKNLCEKRTCLYHILQVFPDRGNFFRKTIVGAKL